jgi:hypothetical protein
VVWTGVYFDVVVVYDAVRDLFIDEAGYKKQVQEYVTASTNHR